MLYLPHVVAYHYSCTAVSAARCSLPAPATIRFMAKWKCMTCMSEFVVAWWTSAGEWWVTTPKVTSASDTFVFQGSWVCNTVPPPHVWHMQLLFPKHHITLRTIWPDTKLDARKHRNVVIFYKNIIWSLQEKKKFRHVYIIVNSCIWYSVEQTLLPDPQSQS
jgi:hypothetical protein